MERRDVIKGIGAGIGAAASAAPAAALAAPPEAPSGAPRPTVTSRIPENPAMKYRALGTTGERVSLIGVGGFHLAKPTSGTTNDEAIGIVHAAIDQGVNFFDNCWDYNNGESEVRLGRALRGGWRYQVFLKTKVD